MTRLLFCIIIVCCGAATTLSAQQKYLPKVNQKLSDTDLLEYLQQYNTWNDTLYDPYTQYQIVGELIPTVLNTRETQIFPAVRETAIRQYLYKEGYVGYKKPIYRVVVDTLLIAEAYDELQTKQYPLQLQTDSKVFSIDKAYWIKNKHIADTIKGTCYVPHLKIDTCFWKTYSQTLHFPSTRQHTQIQDDSLYVAKKYPAIYHYATVWRIDSVATAQQRTKKKLFTIKPQYKTYRQMTVKQPATWLNVEKPAKYEIVMSYANAPVGCFSEYNVPCETIHYLPIYPFMYPNAHLYTHPQQVASIPNTLPRSQMRREKRYEQELKTLLQKEQLVRSQRKLAPLPPFKAAHFPQSTLLLNQEGTNTIAQIQQDLKKKGYYHDTINNLLTDSTKNALYRFHRKHDKEHNYISLYTLQLLGVFPTIHQAQLAYPVSIPKMKHYCNVVDIKSLLTTADTYHYFQSKQLDYSSRSLTSPYHKVVKKPTTAQFGKTTTDLAQYLSQNPPTFHQLMDKTLSGKMNLSCTIDKNGYLIRPHIIQGMASDIDEAVLQWCYALPPWTPATNNGKAIASTIHLSLHYSWDNDKQQSIVKMIPANNEERYGENEFISTQHLSNTTFPLQTDDSDYEKLLNYKHIKTLPNVAHFRTEEIINHFQYDYPIPADTADFSITTELQSCPWNSRHDLLLVGIRSKKIDFSNAPPTNIVLVLDPGINNFDKHNILQTVLTQMKEALRPQDKLFVINHSPKKEVLVEHITVRRRDSISQAIYDHDANTYISAANTISAAYQIARQHFITGGNNRVILLTAGSTDIGIGDNDSSFLLIQQQQQSGISFDVFSVGYNNFDDTILHKWAAAAQSDYHHLNTKSAARRHVLQKLWGESYIIAQNHTLNIAFNKHYIKGYRLIGYENRQYRNENAINDVRDSEAIGANHTVTALYEIIRDTVQMPISSSKILSDTTAQSTYDGTKAAMFDVQLTYQKPHD
ncbi:MAG: von Willebrand factor type A domain-containing protein, partial [Chitinophagales bacterium]|nr:von Willebrand factor type A domain-containing protein [Chitinophagales bacterium]